jgi:hypothetical protein
MRQVLTADWFMAVILLHEKEMDSSENDIEDFIGKYQCENPIDCVDLKQKFKNKN